MPDKCVIQNGVSSIVREGKLWVIDGKYKVSNLTECKIIEPEVTEPSDDIPATPYATPAPVQEVPIQRAPAPTPTPTHTETRQVDPNAAELNQLLSLAGDNAWLVVAVLLFVFGKQYLEKMEKMKMADTRTKDDLTKECVGRHGVSLDKFKELSDKISEISTKIESAKTDLSTKIDKTRSDGALLERRLMSLEMEMKYHQPSKETPSGRGRPKEKTTDTEN